MTSSSTPGYIPKRIENICPRKNLYASVHSGIIPNGQKVGTTHMSVNRYTDKHTSSNRAVGYYPAIKGMKL